MNFTLNYEEINNINPNDITLDQLLKIRELLGVVIKEENESRDKEDNIKFINYYIEAKQNLPKIIQQLEFEKQQENRLYNTIKQFYGSSELVIKDISRDEQLFWSVFRNKYLNQSIFKFLKLNKTHSYDGLVDIGEIIRKFSNAQSILYDKFKCSKWFNVELYNRRNDLYLLYNEMNKDTLDNREMYKTLFKNYGTEWFKSENYSFVIEQIISSGNIVAFKEFTNVYGINKQVIEGLFNNDEINNGFYDEHILGICSKINNHFELITYQHFKMLKYLKTLSPSIEINRININEFNFFNQSISLKRLIKIDNYLINSNGYKYLLEPNHLHYSTILNSLPTPYEQFTNDQLNQSLIQLLSPLINIELFESRDNDDFNKSFKIAFLVSDTLKLAHFINEFNSTDNLPPYRFYNNFKRIFFQDVPPVNNNNNNNNNNSNNNTQYYINNNLKINNNNKYQLKLNIYNIIKRLNSIQNFKSILYYLYFKNQQIIKKIINQSKLDHILEVVIATDNLDSIIYFTNLVDEGVWLKENENFSYSINEIKSTKVLDYFYKYYQELFFKDENDHFLNTQSLEILIHYENLMKLLSRKFSIKQFRLLNSLRNRKLSQIEKFIRVFENPSLYSIQINQHVLLRVYYSIKHDIIDLSYSGKDSLFFKLINIFKTNKINIGEIFDLKPIYSTWFPGWLKNAPIVFSESGRYYHSLVNNPIFSSDNGEGNNSYGDNDDQDKILIFEHDQLSLSNLLYSKGDIKSIIDNFKKRKKDLESSNYQELKSFISQKSIPLYFYQIYLNEFKDQEPFISKFIDSVLLRDLQVFKYFILNHGEIFLKYINNIIIQVFILDKYQICQFMLNFITIRKVHYDNYINKTNRYDKKSLLLIYKKLYKNHFK